LLAEHRGENEVRPGWEVKEPSVDGDFSLDKVDVEAEQSYRTLTPLGDDTRDT
jgi:hypothetical protein